MLTAPPPGLLTWHEVTSAVNKVGNDDPRLIQSMTEEERAADAETAVASKKQARAEKSRRQTDVAGDNGQGSLF